MSRKNNTTATLNVGASEDEYIIWLDVAEKQSLLVFNIMFETKTIRVETVCPTGVDFIGFMEFRVVDMETPERFLEIITHTAKECESTGTWY